MPCPTDSEVQLPTTPEGGVDHKRVVLVIGNGVAKTVVDDTALKAVEWGNILMKWLEKVQTTEMKLDDVSYAIAILMAKSDNTDLLVEAASLILSRLSDSEKEEVLKETFELLWERRRAPGGYQWVDFFRELSQCIKSGLIDCPAILTTNFDDLVVRATNLILRCWTLREGIGIDRIRRPLPGASSSRALRKRSVSRKGLCEELREVGLRTIPPHLKRLMDFGHLENLRSEGFLGANDGSIYHIHGWWKMLDSLVFDAAGYDRSIFDLPRISGKLGEWLSLQGYTVFFLGVGYGMEDRRFREIWKPPPGGNTEAWMNNHWVVTDSSKYTPMVERLKAKDKVSLLQSKRDDQPVLMRKVLGLKELLDGKVALPDAVEPLSGGAPALTS